MKAKYILIGSPFFLLLIQLLTFEFIGKKSIEIDSLEHIEVANKHKGKVGVLINKELNEVERSKIISVLSEKYDSVDLTNDSLYWKSVYFNDANVMAIAHSYTYVLPFKVNVTETIGTFGYIEIWESEFVWVLGKWIMLRKENKIQS